VLESDEKWHTRCAIFMPDHVHLLITLASNGDLSESVRLFKGRLTPALRGLNSRWQPSFYDHRLRNDEEVLPVFLYIYLNPYRTSLCHAKVKWPGYYCSPDDWLWFGALTNKDCPELEWLR
jgi:REP element-mobilizing transposase RayT